MSRNEEVLGRLLIRLDAISGTCKDCWRRSSTACRGCLVSAVRDAAKLARFEAADKMATGEQRDAGSGDRDPIVAATRRLSNVERQAFYTKRWRLEKAGRSRDDASSIALEWVTKRA